jgi:hypothetical protein
MIFNINDRVILINTERLWGIDDHNPLWESKYKTVGTVTKIYQHKREGIDYWWYIKVEWDNGASNMYNDSHLKLYSSNQLPKELFEI